MRNRDFCLYLFGLMVSLAGNYMQIVADGWLVYRLTNSAFSLGLVSFIAMLPLGPWALVAGVLADQMPRRALLAISQIIQVIPPMVLAALTWSGHVQVWHVILVNLTMGAMAAIDNPTRQALVVDIVESKDLANALALTASGINVSRVIGPAIAGVLISSIGLEGVFVLNGLSFLAVLIALAIMRIPKHERPAQQASLGANLVEGGQYLVGERTILALVILMTIVSFFVLPYQTLLPVFARDILKAGATGLGFLTSTAGFGAILGALAVANLSSGQRGKLAIVLVLMIALLTAGFATSTNLVLSCLILILISGGVVALKTLGFTLIQIRTRDELRGRVTSILLLLMGATPRLGGLLAGYLASWMGAPLTLGLGALGCLACGLLTLTVVMPWLRRLA